MSRFRTSIVPTLVGLYLLSALLHSGFSLSNILNLLRVAIGLLLVGYGIWSWFRVAEVSEHSSPLSGALDAHPKVSDKSLPSSKVSNETPKERAGFKRYYLIYLKYLVAAPLAIAVVLWVLAFKVAGCEASGATMQVYGCSAIGVALTHIQLYVMLFAAAMCTVLLPLTIVYLLIAVGKRSS